MTPRLKGHQRPLPEPVRRVPGMAWLIVTRIGALFVILELYTWFRKTYFVPPAPPAFAHARQILSAEQALGLDVELSLQRWALRHDWLIHACNAYYREMKMALYVSAILALLLAPGAFRRYSRVFAAVTLIALPWYALYPLAPPRFMDRYGFPFVDTLARATANPGGNVGTANPYAAMPSMHIGWSVIAALFLAAALPWWRIGAILGTLHVALMTFTVMATGNHYLFDILAGLMVDIAAIAIVAYVPARLLWAMPRRYSQPANAAGQPRALSQPGEPPR